MIQHSSTITWRWLASRCTPAVPCRFDWSLTWDAYSLKAEAKKAKKIAEKRKANKQKKSSPASGLRNHCYITALGSQETLNEEAAEKTG